MTTQNRVRLDFLDGLRGLAAVYVVFYHALSVLWEGFTNYGQHPELYSFPDRILAHGVLGFYFGRQAVMFFFILSGFVIHYRYAIKLKTAPSDAKFDLLSYLWRRARRIYPPLIFALLLTLVVDQVGINLGFSIYFERVVAAIVTEHPHDLTTFVGNLLFLNTAYVPTFGTDEPLWSLMREWWFYMLYPLLWLVNRRSAWMATALVVVLFGLSFIMPNTTVFILAKRIFASLLAWWLGAILADVYVGRIQIKLKWIALLALLCIPLAPTAFIQLTVEQLAVHDVLWSLAFIGILAGLLSWQRRGGSLGILERLGLLGDISYTLYVTHFPVMVFVGGWYFDTYGSAPIGTAWIFIGTLICVVVAWAAHFVTEKPFVRSRKSAAVTSPAPT